MYIIILTMYIIILTMYIGILTMYSTVAAMSSGSSRRDRPVGIGAARKRDPTWGVGGRLVPPGRAQKRPPPPAGGGGRDGGVGAATGVGHLPAHPGTTSSRRPGGRIPTPALVAGDIPRFADSPPAGIK